MDLLTKMCRADSAGQTAGPLHFGCWAGCMQATRKEARNREEGAGRAGTQGRELLAGLLCVAGLGNWLAAKAAGVAHSDTAKHQAVGYTRHSRTKHACRQWLQTPAGHSSTNANLKGRRVQPAYATKLALARSHTVMHATNTKKGVHKQWHHHRQAQQQSRRQGELLKPAAACIKIGLRHAALRCRQGVQAATISNTKQFLAHNSSTSMLSHLCGRHGNTLCV